MVPTLDKESRERLEMLLYRYWYLSDTDKLKRCIDRGVSALTEDEKEVIKVKYFDRTRPSDVKALMNIDMSNSKYYRVKKSALEKMAIALNVV